MFRALQSRGFLIIALLLVGGPFAHALDVVCRDICAQSEAVMSKASGPARTNALRKCYDNCIQCPQGLLNPDGSCYINNTPSASCTMSSDGICETSSSSKAKSTGSENKSAGSSSSASASKSNENKNSGSESGDNKNATDTKNGGTSTDTEEDQAKRQAQRQTCQAALATVEQICQQGASAAAYSCDQGGSWQELLGEGASQGSLIAGAATSGINAACSKFANYVSVANGALVLYRTKCQSGITGCLRSCLVDTPESCANDADLVESSSLNLKASYLSCQQYSAKIQQAQQAMQQIAVQKANATACALATSAEIPSYCQQNPTATGCPGAKVVDCSDSSMATNKVCVCSKNPSDPTCQGVASTTTSSGSLASSNPQDRLLSKNALPSELASGSGDVPTTPGINQGPSNNGAAAASVDGQQGGRANLSVNGGTGSSGNSRVRSKNGKEPAGVLDGFFAGGGRSGSSASMTMGGAGGTHSNSRSPASVANGSPDLSAFLPQGGFRSRVIGGNGATGPDGITGPHTNIWQKVQNRYQSVSPSLNP